MTDLEIERTGAHTFTARNGRGARVRLGRAGAQGSFSPGELLQLAAAGCAALTAEELVVRRTGDDAPFTASVGADREPGGREYDAVHVRLGVDLSGVEEATRARVVKAVREAVARECTVSRTVERGAAVTLEIDAFAADEPGPAVTAP